MKTGQPFRAGIVNVGMTNTAMILDSIDINRGTYPDTTTAIATTMKISLGKRKDLQTVSKPPITLILAAPRPLRLERILPVVSTLGVNHIAIIGAEKVQKDYLGIQLLQKPEMMRPLLIEGLEQVEVDYHLPTYSVHKSFHKFITFDIKSIDSSSSSTGESDAVEYVRIVTQPQFPTMIDPSSSSSSAEGEGSRLLPPSIRISELFQELYSNDKNNKVSNSTMKLVIAIGPEGGWTFDELYAFVKRGYRLVHFGDRILRTDTAVWL
jgi:16S rRNA U1498 N3-methylase RsmE